MPMPAASVETAAAGPPFAFHGLYPGTLVRMPFVPRSASRHSRGSSFLATINDGAGRAGASHWVSHLHTRSSLTSWTCLERLAKTGHQIHDRAIGGLHEQNVVIYADVLEARRRRRQSGIEGLRQRIVDHGRRQGLPNYPPLLGLPGWQATIVLLRQPGWAVAVRKFLPVIGRHGGAVPIDNDEWPRSLSRRPSIVLGRGAASVVSRVAVTIARIAVIPAFLGESWKRQDGADNGDGGENVGAHACATPRPATRSFASIICSCRD
jgi:hypothetical protein